MITRPDDCSQLGIAEVLTYAADVADRQRTVERAKRAAWSACHANRDLIGPVFGAWQRSEDVTYLYDLGGVLSRRYRRSTPADIAESLRRAAAMVRGGAQ
jgi:hypothetical protein